MSAKLAGLLGRRYALSHERRLLAVDEDELLAGFRRRPGAQAWIGEHVGKWLHAASLVFTQTADARLAEKIARVRDGLLATQEKDGYLGTYAPGKRFGLFEDADWDVWVHKYVLIGLLAEHAAFGTRASLDAAVRVGELLVKTFVIGQRDINAAGQHRGMAATSVLEPVMLLHRATGVDRFRTLGSWILEAMCFPNGSDLFRKAIHVTPVNEIANGKAYELLSNALGLCEFQRSQKGDLYLHAAEMIWLDVERSRLYPTGGASAHEFFQPDGVFPTRPEDEICETCVTVTWIQLSARLLELTGDAQYAVEIERAAFNHLLGAQRPDGAAWCYYTPLEGVKAYRTDVNCCLSSGPRGLAILPEVAVAAENDEVRVNLLAFSEARARVRSTDVRLVLDGEEDYPAGGRHSVAVDVPLPTEFTLAILVPATARPRKLVLPGGKPLIATPGEYARIRREWSAGDVVQLDLELDETPIDGAPFGRPGEIARRRGPLVLATEEGRDEPVPFAEAGASGAAFRTWARA